MSWRWISAGVVLSLGMGGVSSSGQVVERQRDVTITGPRGRSIERSFTSERGRGFADRQVTIQRPGGTFRSNTLVERVGRPGGFVPPGHWGGGWGPRGRVIVERPVIVGRGGGGGGWLPGMAVGGGLFGLGMLAGSALASPPPPPPVYVAPAPPPTVVYNPPQPYSPAPPPPATVVVDPVASAIGRLSSHHDNSRRDGAITLGRLRDPRAVNPLVERLKYDPSKDVRVASATALGEIGDPRAAIFLQRATVYDKKQAVRDAAAAALSRLPREVPAGAVAAEPGFTPQGTVSSTVVSSTPITSGVPTAPPIEDVPPPPTPPAGSNNSP
jgi:hypothetical protein